MSCISLVVRDLLINSWMFWESRCIMEVANLWESCICQYHCLNCQDNWYTHLSKNVCINYKKGLSNHRSLLGKISQLKTSGLQFDTTGSMVKRRFCLAVHWFLHAKFIPCGWGWEITWIFSVLKSMYLRHNTHVHCNVASQSWVELCLPLSPHIDAHACQVKCISGFVEQ